MQISVEWRRGEVSSLLEGLYLKNAAGRVLRTTPAVPPLTAPSIVAILTSSPGAHALSVERSVLLHNLLNYWIYIGTRTQDL